MNKRPLCLICIAFVLGILVENGLRITVFFFTTALLFLIGVFLFSRVKKHGVILLLTLISFTAGGMLFNYSEKNYLFGLDEYYGKQLVIEGYISSEPEEDENKVKFTFKTSSVSGKSINKNLLFYVYNKSESSFNNNLRYGTTLTVRAEINRPKPATNPGGFNYQRYLASIGISGTVNIMNTSDVKITGKGSGFIIKKLGYKIKNTVLGIVGHCLAKNQAGLLAGMIIGYKDGLDQNAFEAFSRAGLTHIMVASGMNVAFIILPLSFLFRKLRLTRNVTNIIIICILVLFIFVTGFSASVVRAVIMGIIILSGQMIMRETDIYTSISTAVLSLLLYNPFMIFDIGFQLSFAATLSLVMLYPSIKATVSFKYIPEIFSDTLAATLAAQLGVIPISIYYFNSLSLISVISNLLVVPTVQIITIIGFVMVFSGLVNINLAVLIGYINNSILSFVLFVTEISSKLPYASIKVPTPSILMVCIYYIIVLYFFKGRRVLSNFISQKRLALAVIIILLLNLTCSRLLPKPIEITFLDVGQGDGAFIRTAHGTKVLIDGGGKESDSKSSFDVGKSVMVPYILDQGTKKIDIVIASHGHADHTEGLEAVLKEFKIGLLILPDTDGQGFDRISSICSEKGIRIVKCSRGNIIKLDNDTKFEVLSPLEFSKDSLSQQSLNNSSLVLKLIYKNINVLFTGDSEIPVEDRLLETGTDISVDLVKIAHHGSNTSSGDAFINRVNPRYAVISVGEHNHFGHPSQVIIDRMAERNIKLFRTDLCGAVIAKSYGTGIEFSTMLD